MTKEEKKIGIIAAVLYASESTIQYASEKGVEDTVIMAKITAYDHIVRIMKEENYLPWRGAE